jgi:hypothetical protein
VKQNKQTNKKQETHNLFAVTHFIMTSLPPISPTYQGMVMRKEEE